MGSSRTRQLPTNLGWASLSMNSSTATTVPNFTPRQFVAATLLCFKDRSATREQIMLFLVTLPSISLVGHSNPLSLIFAFSQADLVTINLNVRAVNTLRLVAHLLDSDAKKYYSNFPLKEALQPINPGEFELWRDNAFQDINEESQDPDGPTANRYNLSKTKKVMTGKKHSRTQRSFWERLVDQMSAITP